MTRPSHVPFGAQAQTPVPDDTAVAPGGFWEGKADWRESGAKYHEHSGIRLVAPDRACAKRAQENLLHIQKRLEKHLHRGRWKKALELAGIIWRSKSARIRAAALAMRDVEFIPGERIPTALELMSYVWGKGALEGPVSVKAIERGNSRFRALVRYGLPDKVRQHLFALSFGKLIEFDKSQYGVPGRSGVDAVRHIEQLLRSGPYRYAVELDIAEFFRSIYPDAVASRFGVPRWIRDEVMTNRGKETRNEIIPANRFTRTMYSDIHDQIVQGLPLGMLASPLLAYGLLKTPLEQFRQSFGEAVVVVNYCDNFLLLARSVADLRAGTETLIESLRAIPQAHFETTQKSDVRRLSDGIDFIGFHFKRKNHSPFVSIKATKKARYLIGVLGRVRDIERGIDGLVCDRDHRIQIAAAWAHHRLPQFLAAPNDCRELMRRIADGFRPYAAHRRVKELFRFIAKKAPEEDALEGNFLGGRRARAETRSRPRARPQRLSSLMVSVPRGWTPFAFTNAIKSQAGSSAIASVAGPVAADLSGRNQDGGVDIVARPSAPPSPKRTLKPGSKWPVYSVEIPTKRRLRVSDFDVLLPLRTSRKPIDQDEQAVSRPGEIEVQLGTPIPKLANNQQQRIVTVTPVTWQGEMFEYVRIHPSAFARPESSVTWRVSEGQFVRAGDIIADWEDDLATMEIAAPTCGTLHAHFLPDGPSDCFKGPIAILKTRPKEAKASARRKASRIVFDFPATTMTLTYSPTD